MREERIGNQTLILADCREVLAGLTVDCFLTDPFYGIDGGRGHDSLIRAKGHYTAANFEDTPEAVKAIVVPVIASLDDLCERGAVTPGIRCLMDYPKPADMGCFWAPAAARRGPWGFGNFNPILYYGRDFRAGLGPWPSGRQLTEIPKKNGHPCPKPLGAWKWLLEKVSMEGETVIDPFLGSGTTLVACQQLGRHGIGIEICEEYFEIACKRVERAARGLVDEAMVSPPVDERQTSLFTDDEETA